MSFWPTRGIRESDLFILIKSLSIGNALIFVALFIYIARQVHYYRPSTKLFEGNVFSHMSLSVCSQGGGGLHVTATHDSIGQSHGRAHPHPTPPHMRTPLHPQDMFKLFPLGRHHAGTKKRAIGLRLKDLCFHLIGIILYCYLILHSL